jgi:primosomal protein N' (replication factor Y)
VNTSGRPRSGAAAWPEIGALVARVLPAVAGLDKEFDYLVPAGMTTQVRVGTLVRIELAGRRVGGWVVAVGPADRQPDRPLLSLAKVRGWGPEPEVVELTRWAAWRWAGRRDAVLATASPAGAVVRLPPPRGRPPRRPEAAQVPAGLLADLPLDRPVTLRLPPAADLTPLAAELAQRGPLLVVVPTVQRAEVLAGRLRRAGGDVAEVAHDWAGARAGAAVVIGSRAAAWAPCPELSAVLVIDGHDEGLGQEQAPTWHAAVVAAERARLAAVPCVITSSCPILDLLAAGPVRVVDRTSERRGWARVEVIDRRGHDPREGLYSQPVVAVLRGPDRVVCVLNRRGRARLLACAACGELARCEQCGAAVAQDASQPPPYPLACPRCGLVRPQVCTRCGSTVLRLLRVGVSRAREELELLAGRTVGEVTGDTAELPDDEILVGTEAVLHRVAPRAGVGVVVFLDFDQDLLASRVRAGEEALALLAAASRLVSGRRGRVLVQTRVPAHPALHAAQHADPAVLTDEEAGLRQHLRLPPYASVALVSGPAAGAYVEGLQSLSSPSIEIFGPDGREWLVKAPDPATLADALAAVARPPGRLRVAVDPARL